MKKLSAVLAVLLAAAIVFCGVTISQKNKLDTENAALETKVTDSAKALEEANAAAAQAAEDAAKALEDAKAEAAKAAEDAKAEAAKTASEEAARAAEEAAKTASEEAAKALDAALAAAAEESAKALEALQAEADAKAAAAADEAAKALAAAQADAAAATKALEEANAAAAAASEDSAKALEEARAEAAAAAAALEAAKADAETAAKAASEEAAKALDEVKAEAEELEAAQAEAAAAAAAALEAAQADAAAAAKALDEANAKVAALEDNVQELQALLKGDFAGKTVILHSNDVHGALEGYAYITALKDIILSRGATDVILADAGDFSQGTPYVSLSKGANAVEMMNTAGYDVVTLGNHEFDFGYDQLMSNLYSAHFTAITANVLLDENNDPILPTSMTFGTKSGLKISFVGLETPETATKVNPAMISNIHFTTFDDLYTTAQAAVDSVREDSDLVIGLWHLGVDDESAQNGYRSYDVLQKVTGVDFVIDGHSHSVMTEGANGEPIQSTGTAFANIGVIVIDNAKKAIVDHYLISTDALYPDPDVHAAALSIIGAVDGELARVFAQSEVDLNGERSPGNRTEETNMGDLITDALVWSVTKDGGIEQVEPNQIVGITNGGGIRAPIAAGPVTMKDVNTVLPFGNTVAVVYVTGEQLLEVLEASTYCTPESIGGYPQTSGIVWTLDTTKEYGKGDVYVLDGKESSYYAPASIQRVTIESVNGEPFDPAATYAVVTNNFCSAGGDTYNVLAQSFAETGFDTGIPMDEALIQYITEVLQGTITEEAYGAPRGFATQIK